MLFLVTGRIEGTAEPTTEFLQASHDTLEQLSEMERNGKVRAGGVFIGPLAVCFIVDCESNDDLPDAHDAALVPVRDVGRHATHPVPARHRDESR